MPIDLVQVRVKCDQFVRQLDARWWVDGEAWSTRVDLVDAGQSFGDAWDG
jgi:hypothetical protein